MQVYKGIKESSLFPTFYVLQKKSSIYRLNLIRSKIKNVLVTCQDSDVTVKIQPPLGVVLESLDNGRGVFVREIVPESNAAKCGKLEIGDIITQICGESEEVLLDFVEKKLFDDVLNTLQKPSISFFMIKFRRPQLVPLEDVVDTSKYWETQRLKKLQGPRVLRRTVGIEPKDININNTGKIGEGNFGIVFGGTWKGGSIILKTSKSNILGSEFLLENELFMNEVVHKEARGSCARFLGCCEVGEIDSGEIYNGTLSSGLWLLWLKESEITLGDILHSFRASLHPPSEISCIQYLRSYFGCELSEIAVYQLIIKSIANCLLALHSVGIVHRDIKPDNILILPTGIKFIDLGSAAKCLGKPINYFPGEGPADPRYCKDDDLYLLPKGTPKPENVNLEELWKTYFPDRFDIYSTGITLLQVFIPPFYDDRNLAKFNKEFKECKYDLMRWRSLKCDLPDQYLKVLDENEGCGWDLIGKLLVDERSSRITAQEILLHSFLNL